MEMSHHLYAPVVLSPEKEYLVKDKCKAIPVRICGGP
jgi:hypothetical protein